MGLFFIVFASVLYGSFTWLTFNDEVRESNFFWIYGLVYAVLANFSWVILVKSLSNSKHIVYYSVAWDTATTIVGLAVPIIFFGLRFSSASLLGMMVVIIGTLIMKFGET